MDFNKQNILGMIARNQVNPRGAIAYQDQMKQQEAQQQAMEAQKLQAAQLLNKQRQQALQQAGQPQFQRVQGRDGNLYEVQVNPQTGQLMGQPRPVQGLGQAQKKIPDRLVPYLPPELQVNPQAATTADLVAAARKAQEEANQPSLAERKFEADQQAALQERQADQQREAGALDAMQSKATLIDGKVKEAIKIIEDNPVATGGFIGGMSSNIYGTDAYSLEKTVQTIKANLAFDELQKMRAASKTGGALGAVSERELGLLESAVASLDPGLPRSQLMANLQKVNEHYQNWLKAQSGGQGVQVPQSTEPVTVIRYDAQGNRL